MIAAQHGPVAPCCLPVDHRLYHAATVRTAIYEIAQKDDTGVLPGFCLDKGKGTFKLGLVTVDIGNDIKWLWHGGMFTGQGERSSDVVLFTVRIPIELHCMPYILAKEGLG